jgi:hypothetical protein
VTRAKPSVIGITRRSDLAAWRLARRAAAIRAASVEAARLCPVARRERPAVAAIAPIWPMTSTTAEPAERRVPTPASTRMVPVWMGTASTRASQGQWTAAACTDLTDDFDTCGACGAPCAYPGQYEDGACVDGHCFYSCVPGAVDCGGTCTDLSADPDNCGACGNICPGSAPFCIQGGCVCPSGMAVCDGECVDIWNDPDNCGACGAGCPSSAPYCRAGVCYDCGPGLTVCFYGCADLSSDANNCGACGYRCGSGETCSSGSCQGICYGCEW